MLAFVDDPGLIGARSLGKYIVTVTSGTTRTRGVFLMNAAVSGSRLALNKTDVCARWVCGTEPGEGPLRVAVDA